MLLTGNNVSRIIQMFGLPCSCIVMNALQLYSSKHIFQCLKRWERCLDFIIIKSIDSQDLDDSRECSRSNSAASSRDRKSSEVFHKLTALHESSSSSQVPNTESSLTALSENISDGEIISEQSQDRESKCVDVYIVAKRDPAYTKDAAVEVKQMIQKYVKGDVSYLTTTPSAPQDLVQINLKVYNMRTYECVKTVEQLLQEYGSFNIEIDLASGYVSFHNTESSAERIVQVIKDAGFGCSIVESNNDTILKPDSREENNIKKYRSAWMARTIISLMCTIVMVTVRLVLRENSIVTYVNLVVIVFLIVIDYPSLKSGLVTSIVQKRLLPETGNSIGVVFNLGMSVVEVCYILVSSKEEQRQINRLDISNSASAILSIISLARLIEQFGKKSAAKNFQGLAETLPEDVYIVQNLMLDDLAR